nr:PREDICTED: uncharacterized protein LOC109434872 isoform X2 [Rhinolophus sinicus]
MSGQTLLSPGRPVPGRACGLRARPHPHPAGICCAQDLSARVFCPAIAAVSPAVTLPPTLPAKGTRQALLFQRPGSRETVETEAQAGLNCSCAVNPELDSDRLGPSILDPLLTTSQRPGQVRGVASLFRAPAPSSGNPNVLLCKAASVSGVLMLEEVIHTCGTSALTSFIRSFAHSAVSSVTKPRLTSLISSLDLAGGDGAQLGEGRAAPRQVRGKWGLAEGGILESPWGGKTGEGGWL